MLRTNPTDVSVAAAMTLLSVLDIVLTPDWRGPTAVNLAVVPAVTATLIWRRRRPLIPLAATTLGIVGLGIAFGSSQTWTNVFVPAVAVYSGAAYARSLTAVVALSATASLSHAYFDTEVDSFGDAIWGSSLTGLVLLAGLAGRHMSKRSEALDDYAAKLARDDAARAEAAAAEERQRIARELHDIVAHSLGVLVLQAGAAEQALARNPDRVRDVLRSMRQTGQDAIGEMATLLGAMRADPRVAREPQPALTDLDELVGRIRSAGVPVDLDVRLSSRPISAAVQLSAYRVAQEALTNVLKHAPGASTTVTVEQLDHALEVRVVNAASAVPAEHAPGSRQGLLGLAERLKIFGGHLSFGPRDEGGWTVRATFPVAL